MTYRCPLVCSNIALLCETQDDVFQQVQQRPGEVGGHTELTTTSMTDQHTLLFTPFLYITGLHRSAC